MSKITRQKAAQLLGVSEQTISNYWKEGLLGGAKGKGNILYINEDDLNRLAHEYKMTAASERLLKQKQEKLREERAKVDEEMEKLRISCLLDAPKYFADRLTQLLVNLYRAGIVYMPKREIEVLDAFFHGYQATYLAGKYNLSVARIQQIVENAMKRFEDTASISESFRYFMDVEEENEILKKQLSAFKEKYEKDELMKNEDMTYITTLLSTRLIDLNLSVRVLNATKMNDIQTLDELLKVPKEKVLGFRNMGKKSFQEIEGVIEALSLDWRKNGETDEKFYKRMIKHKNIEKYEKDY